MTDAKAGSDGTVDVPARDVQSERIETDRSLQTERDRTDDEIAARQGHVDDRADEVVQEARERAESVLLEARSDADRKPDRASPGQATGAVAAERAREDTAILAENAEADATLSDEREDRQQALAALLALERSETDQRLVVERARADDVLATRDDFLGIVSHDLRTLLGSIVIDAAQIIRNADDDPEGRSTVRAADRIQRMTVRMSRLLGDLLDVVSIEAGRLRIQAEEHDALHLLRETADAFQASADAKGISLTRPAVEGRFIATFDEQRILQVLANLVSNAIKFSGSGSTISLGIERDQDGLRLSVTDAGPGIPAGKEDQIFERFWQARGGEKGFGIGLYIAKTIVEAHTGRIWVESSAGAGSTFFFTLPAMPARV